MYYKIASESDCVVGIHWMGVYYMEGYGVAQNLDKSEELLLTSAKAGNGQSCYQLYILYSTMGNKKNTVKAYRFLNKALQLGVTHFEESEKYFKANFDVLSPVFQEIRKPPADLNGKDAILNLHEAYLSELKEGFSSKLEKDRMYQRAAGFVTDQ